MGYGFIGKHRKTDEESIFYEECMYAYQPVFRKCFGKEITEFSGRITKKKIEEFKIGLERFKSNPNNNRDYRQSIGYLSNITYDKLCERLSELLELMEDKKVCYLIIM
jgi:hypothetical protein